MCKNMEKTPFFKKTWFIILLFWIVPPIGIALMWTCRREWKKGIKIALSVIFGIWFFLWCVLLLSPSDGTSNDNTPAAEDVTTVYDEDNNIIPEETTARIPSYIVDEVESETREGTATDRPAATEIVKPSTTKAPTTASPATTKKETTTPKPTTTKPTTTKAPATQNAGTNYVLNNNTMKFHYPTCRAVDDISPENKGTFKGDRQTLINRGYKSCGICHP